MFDFGDNADYMAMGYAVTGLFLGGMVLWMYLRYRVLGREQDLIDQIEAEERDGKNK
ncbi:MAG: hypothetical protein JXA10_02490 [Anaerolineae bacterium]|nr:hypothetical protein [Anaerolineae bacterium]